jgi:hypothetical protein
MPELTVQQLSDFDVLDVYEGGVKEFTARVDALATISAGRRVQKGDKSYPEVSRDGTIFLHDPEGRAPGLAAILKESPKRLTITFPFDSPQKFVQQRFMRYSASRLEVHGDQNAIAEIVETSRSKYEHRTYPAGTPEYAELVKTCKVSVSVYFLLSEWDSQGNPRILLPDGLGFYRLRFTSRNSLSNLLAQMRLVHEFTQGRLAGVPFDLQLINREVADPSGAKRTVPVWTITMKRPGEMSMDTRVFRQALEGGISEGQRLKLPPPQPETIDVAMLEPDLDLDTVELDDQSRRMLETGIDPAFRIRQWHGCVKGTTLDDDQARHDFLVAHTRWASLSDAVKYLSQGEWDDLLSLASQSITAHQEAVWQQQGEERLQDPSQYPEGVTDEHRRLLTMALKKCSVKAAQNFDFVSFLSGVPVKVRADMTPEVIEKALGKVGRWRGDDFVFHGNEKLADVALSFMDYLKSDEQAAQVLG